ncbi:MAG: Phospholipase C [Chrysothrix sp. TS-e1954]|nr:MAG: Phospholipase C [Chrysothrix sp. TS-e1954]
MSFDTIKASNPPPSTRSNGKQTVPTSSTSNSTRTSISASSTPYRFHSSIPPSPEILQSSTFPDEATIGTFELPTSPMIPPPASPAVSDANFQHKPPGLMRRISRGAHNKLRARASTSNLRNRENNSGPTVLRQRQRSDSKTFTDGSVEVSDLDLDDLEALNLDSPSLLEDHGLPSPSPNFPRGRRKYLGDDGSILTPSMLLEGTRFMKITKKKKEPLVLQLDCDDNNKIFWSHVGSSSKRQIYIDDIKEIRADADVHNYLDEFDQPVALLSRWMTIIYADYERGKGGALKSKHLLAPDAESCKQWTSFLRFLMNHRGALMVGMGGNDDETQQRFWDRMMSKQLQNDPGSENVHTVDFQKLKESCHGLAIYKSDKDLRDQWNQVDTQQTGRLNRTQFKEFFRLINYRRDIADVFEFIKPHPWSLSLSELDFFHFLHQYQGINISQDEEWWRGVFEQFATAKEGFTTLALVHETPSTPLTMDLEAFQEFLISAEHNPALVRSIEEPRLDCPLNEYFISSSHNTYLSAGQLRGESTSECYTDALRKGCRCVEIDCWDGDDGKPKVTHGFTRTTKITFQECVKTINKHAFDASPYPLIISLEVHCNPVQQRIMAGIMKESFGDKLLLAPLEGADSLILPSPEQLKGKILIKVKKPHAENTSLVAEPPKVKGPNAEHTSLVAEPPNVTRHRRQRSKSEVSTASTRNAPPPLPSIGVAPYSPQSQGIYMASPMSRPLRAFHASVPGSSNDEEDLEATYGKRGKVKTSKIIPELGNLGVYVRGIKFGGFKAAESRTYNHVFSFTEGTFESRCKTPDMKHLMEKHNRKYLMRVYPQGTRFTSSNPNPLQFWRRGVQMVATNWQTPDVGTQINNAMFAAGHDRTGYVLKPEEMRRSRDYPSFEQQGKVFRKKVQFSVDIISANRLEVPPGLAMGATINPYVEIEIFSADDKAKGLATAEGGKDVSHPNGTSGLNLPKRRRSKIMKLNGHDPRFDEPIKVALETKYSSLVFVRLTVWHSPDGHNTNKIKEPIGTYTAKLDSLNQGYRQIHLHNRQQEQLISTLFLYIHKEQNQDLQPLEPEWFEPSVETKAVDETGSRAPKGMLRRFLSRTPSGRKRSKDNGNESSFSRTTSIEK